jgi:FkbM family methyltransferase
MGLSYYIEDLFLNLQASLRPTFSIEVGAYNAEFSKNIKKIHSSMNVYAFEASRFNYAKFQHDLIGAWGVNYIHSAVSNIVGSIEFNYQVGEQSDAPNNSILQRVGAVQNPEVVPSTTLDHFFIESNLMAPHDSACLWIDVEGAAGLVLPSAERLLAQTQTVLIEVEHHRFWQNQWLSGDVRSFLETRGFFLIGRDLEYHPTQENFLFARLP